MDIVSNARMQRTLPLFSAAAALALVVALGAVLYFGRDLLVPLALAVLLSFVLSPLVRAFRRIGLPRPASVVASLCIALAAALGFFWLVSGQMADVGEQIPTYRATIHDKIQGIANHFAGNGEMTRIFATLQDVAKDVSAGSDGKDGQPKATRVVVVDDSPFGRLGSIGGYAVPLLGPIAVLAAVLVLTGFMLAQREDLRNRLVKLMGAGDIRQSTEVIDDAARRVGRMLLTQLVLNFTFGLVIAGGLALIGLPNAILWGALAAVARFVPYLGVAIGVVPPLLVAFAFDPHWAPFLETFALFACVEAVTGQILEPLLLGHSSGVSPMAVVVSTALWAFFWGPIGIILATPMTICLVVLGRHIPSLEFLATLLSDEPPLEPYEMFYQRMLAGDPNEAVAQARAFLRGRDSATYYDEIALRAVQRAHLDLVRDQIDEPLLEKLLGAMRSVVEKLGVVGARRAKPRYVSPETAAALSRVRVDRPDSLLVVAKEDLPPQWRTEAPVAVLYGDHPLDEIVASMLAQVLTRHGLAARALSLDDAAGADEESAKSTALVCLCFVEPLSTLHLRAAGAAVRRRCPQAKTMLCVWQAGDDATLQKQKSSIRVDAIVTTISDALGAAFEFCAATHLTRPQRAARLRSERRRARSDAAGPEENRDAASAAALTYPSGA